MNHYPPPLWLPIGSIRAIIALGMVAAAICALVVNINVPEWFALLLGIVVRDYFESRRDTDQDGEPDDQEVANGAGA